MTEVEWLRCEKVWELLRVIHNRTPSERKGRLWNAAVCRRWLEHMPTESLAILEHSERIADGLSVAENDMNLCGLANAVVHQIDGSLRNQEPQDQALRIQRNVAAAVCYAVIPNELFGAMSYFHETEGGCQLHLLCDIFGNPFRPVAFDPRWRSESAVALARTAYDTRNFSLLPILADALEDAGCDSAEVLAHCRDPNGVHVRGCWVVDGVLGKQ